MITIKSGSYNKEEKRKLADFLNKAVDDFVSLNCTVTHCGLCKYRHICEDLHRVQEYMNDMVSDLH